VSIQELFPGALDGPGDDRLPPQDVHAEQSVLGSMLLSKDAIADAVEVLRGVDFYRPAHESIYEAILDLYGRGEPADAVTVADELTKRGALARVGGGAFLHQLISSVPTAANAGYYAHIVAERAVLRRLVEAGTRIVQLGYAQSGGDVEDIVNAAQAEVYSVSDKRGGEDYTKLGDILELTVDEIEVASGKSGEMTGVPTGFTDLDALTNGLHPGQMIVLAARPAMGKALALDTPLATPDGWTTMGEVAVGDLVMGADGRPTRVVAATEVMVDRPCYEVEFSDGSVIVADAKHQWLTDTRASRRSFQAARDQRNRTKTQRTLPTVKTTEAIAATLRTDTADQRLNHSVANAAALELDERELPLSPYVLGAWLGDGNSAGAALTSADAEMVMLLEAEGLVVRPQTTAMRYSLTLPIDPAEVRACVVCGDEFTPKAANVVTCGRSCGGRAKGFGQSAECPDCGEPSFARTRCRTCSADHGSVQALLRKVGVLGKKHVPASYLRASEPQRRALLAGLLDTDGTVTNTGSVQFTTTSPALAEGVFELLVSLGYRVGVARKQVRGRTAASSTAYNLNFTTDDDVFRLSRKAILHKERRTKTFNRRGSRFITAVRAVAPVPVRCIEVEAADHLYLAGRSMIPTHNSTLGLDIARSAAIKHNQAAVVFSLEMSKTEITMRLLSAEAQIQLQHMRKGTMREDDWQRLAKTMGRVSDAPLFIDDSPNMSLMEIRAKCRRLKQRHNLKLVVIDYLQLMSSGKRVESRQQEVSEFSRALKLLAKELEVPVIAISQLNRGPEQRTDKRPQMSDLRESGCLTADTRVLRADTGAETTLGTLYAAGARDVPVWALDDTLRYVRRPMTHVFPTGVRPVFRLTLESGKEIRATANHPFLTYAGWSPLGELRTGTRVAVPRHVPAPAFFEPWEDPRVILLAQVLSDPAYTVDRKHANVIGDWLDSLGVLSAKPHKRRLPKALFHVSKPQIALFISHLWSLSGSASVAKSGDRGRIRMESSSRRLVEDVSRLLLRFGISTRLTETEPAGGARAAYRLEVSGEDSQRRFLQEIGLHGESRKAAKRLLEIVRAVEEAGAGTAAVPPRVVEAMRRVMSVSAAPRPVQGMGVAGAGAAGRTPVPRVTGGRRGSRCARSPRSSTRPTWTCMPSTTSSGTRSSRSRPTGSRRSSTRRCWAGTTSWPTGSRCTTRSSRTPTWSSCCTGKRPTRRKLSGRARPT
jgi:replicative DNA helicase